ncbi:hypothetical protein Ocin01_05480 [Orchesella cincta]|uniref:DUF4789 domain-containing protein n=1 Tax=Orchesella cincta TaxID=48709 RepID=A0A1D2N7F0_ORCCI|nr:hypothetical protein Ocin01_05480 [Orchesella cincta]
MLLSEIFAVTLIPSLIANNTGESGGFPVSNRALYNSRALPVASSSSSREDGSFQDDFFNGDFSPSQPIITDPILRDIYEEEKRLDLADGEFDMRSEEARELIHFQRRKLQRERDELARHAASGMSRMLPRPEGRSLFPGAFPEERYMGPATRGNKFENTDYTVTVTEYPILKPSSEEISSERPVEQSTTTTRKPSTGQMGFGAGLFQHVRSGIGKVANTIRKPFVSSPTTTSTTTTTTSTPSGNMRFPDDEYEYSNHLNPNGPNSIVFGEDTSTSKRLNCTGVQTEYNGACHTVLQPLPCPPGQWLIEDEETGRGKCVENKCASEPNHAWFGGQCVMVRSNKGHCHTGMVTYIFKNGEVECDCKENYLYHQRDGNCYDAYSKGPCNNGEVFLTKVTTKGALPASCVKNKCSQEGFFCNAPSCPRDRNCVKLSSNCPGGVWQIDPEKLTPACLDMGKLPQRIIGNVPTLACAPGSRRDILGTCRKPSKITFS